MRCGGRGRDELLIISMRKLCLNVQGDADGRTRWTITYLKGKWPPKPLTLETGSNSLDSLMNTNFGGVCQIHGPSSSGKSQILFSIAARTASLGRKVLFVDTQGKFRPERVNQIAENLSNKLGDPLSLIDVLSSDVPGNIESKVRTSLAEDAYQVLLIDDLSEPYLRAGYSTRATSQLALIMRILSVWCVLSGRRVVTTERLRYDPSLRAHVPLGVEVTCPYITTSIRLLGRRGEVFLAQEYFGDRSVNFRVGVDGVHD
jgi:hypothetical protein